MFKLFYSVEKYSAHVYKFIFHCEQIHYVQKLTQLLLGKDLEHPELLQ